MNYSTKMTNDFMDDELRGRKRDIDSPTVAQFSTVRTTFLSKLILLQENDGLILLNLVFTIYILTMLIPKKTHSNFK